jgi:ATP-binding cassette subfamily B protein
MGRLMDPASAKTEQTNSFLSSIVTLGLVGGVASFTRTIMLNNAKDSIAASLRRETFASLMTQRDLDWFDASENEESGESDTTKSKEDPRAKQPAKSVELVRGMTPAAIGVILKDDVDTAAQTITGTLANLLRSTSSCVFGTYHMLSLNPELVGLSLLVAPVVGTVAFLTRKYLKKVLAIQQKASVNAASFIEDRLSQIMMVKMSNREQDEIASYSRMQDEYVELGKKAAFANGLSMGTMFTLSTSALCGILLTGGKAVEAKRMTHGQLVSFGSYSFMLALGSAGVAKAMGEYMQGVQCAVRLYALAHPEEDENEASKDEVKKISSFDPDGADKISLENVSFAYKGQPSAPVLKDISLSLSRGEVVAIVGKNGSGKTSLASVLAGLYSPGSGSIIVDSKSPVGDSASKKIDYVNELDRASQSALVQVVPQRPALFNTSILENVRYCSPEASDDAVAEAMRAANCDGFVSRLDGGIQYQVGRNGSKLSGGQRQRLGLARALLADPIFLVLDEPASALDSEGETAVIDAVQACRAKNRALLIITHRAKTLSLADRVIVLKEGAVVQEGDLANLKTNKNGELASLMPDLQSL